jgi:uncharacterized protein (DUF58 family)
MLSASEAAQLDRFALSSSRAAASAAGRRPVNARGYSVEFHDYRAYQPGDDPRSIDWTIDARLRHLVVRLYRAEGHVPLHLLVDTSASMAIGSPAKLAAASRVAAALAYVAARHRDPLALATFDASIHVRTPLAAGRPQLLRVLDALQGLSARGRSSADRALVDYGAAARGPGLAVILSDLLSPNEQLDGVKFLLHRGLSVILVHVLADEELEPRLGADVLLFDSEDPSAALVVGAPEVEAYGRRLARFLEGIRSFCAQHRAGYLLLRSSSGFDEMIGGCMRGGILALR